MLRQEPTVSLAELTQMLNRSRPTIARWARRLRVGHRGARREWRFTERDIERLEAAFYTTAARKR